MALNGSARSRNNNHGGRNATEMPLGTLRKGPWKGEEDRILKRHVRAYGEGNWNSCQTISRLMRSGKSCRNRWLNHLRPNLKRGAFSAQEEAILVHLHATYGSKWSLISCQLPGRTDNEIKNYWHTRVKKCQRDRLPIYPNDANRPAIRNPQASTLGNNPTSPASISIYDMFRTTSSRKMPTIPNTFCASQPSGSLNLFHQNNGLSYEQNGATYGQLPELPSSELFSPITTPTVFGNFGASGYVPTTPIEAGGHLNLGMPGNLSSVHEGTGQETANVSSSFAAAAAATVNRDHASTDGSSARETNQLDDDFLRLFCTPALAMSMNDWFDKDGNIVPKYAPSSGEW